MLNDKYDVWYWRRYNKKRHEKKGVPYDENVKPSLVWLYNLGICHICLKYVSYAEVTMDHVHPLCAGGGWTWDNIRPAHEGCNAAKKDYTMSQLEKRGTLRSLRSASHQSGQLALTK